MTIITKKRFCFRQGDDEFTSKGGQELEAAPDWVKETDLFAWGVADGDIIAVQGTTEKAATRAIAEGVDKTARRARKKTEE